MSRVAIHPPIEIGGLLAPINIKKRMTVIHTGTKCYHGSEEVPCETVINQTEENNDGISNSIRFG